MSVSIRLSRVGKRNAPSFKVVATTTRSKRNGIYLDILGHYNPSMKPALKSIDMDKYQAWVSKGAIVSPAVKAIIADEYKYVPYHPKKAKSTEEKAE
ncbi:MAG: hypothetical protein RLY61_922 [Candidatus Parcubacteria bacterium]|jgi:small subunit ribosomal protein S16